MTAIVDGHPHCRWAKAESGFPHHPSTLAVEGHPSAGFSGAGMARWFNARRKKNGAVPETGTALTQDEAV